MVLSRCHQRRNFVKIFGTNEQSIIDPLLLVPENPECLHPTAVSVIQLSNSNFAYNPFNCAIRESFS